MRIRITKAGMGLRVGSEYPVISISAGADGAIRWVTVVLHADDDAAIARAGTFEVIDDTIPSDWVICRDPDGSTETGPASLSDPDFWLDYHGEWRPGAPRDATSRAHALYQAELARLRR